MYDEEEGNEENIEILEGKATLTPLWNFVTKLEGGKGGGSYTFLCPHGCHGGKPYSGSYTHVRRHLRGFLTVMKKGYHGDRNFPKGSS